MRATRSLTGLAVLAAFGIASSPRAAAAEDEAAAPARRPFSLTLDAFIGLDSNPTRVEWGEEWSNPVFELLAGLAYTSGGPGGGLDIRYQITMENYLEQTDLSYNESRFLFRYGGASEKMRYAAGLEQKSLVEPTAIEIDENLTQDLMSYGAEFDLAMGRAEIGLEMSMRSLRCDDADAAPYLNTDSTGLQAEVRYRSQKARNQQLFARIDIENIDYEDDSFRADFDLFRWHVGWRSAERGKSGLEFGFGTDSVSTFGDSEVFTSIRYRTVFPDQGGSLEMAYARDIEPAATADYKSISSILLRYIRTTKSRVSWTLGATSDRAEFTNPDAAPPADYPFSASQELLGGSLDTSVQGDFGPQDRLRGRWYMGFRYSTRSGTAGGAGYGRYRMLAGLSIMY